MASIPEDDSRRIRELIEILDDDSPPPTNSRGTGIARVIRCSRRSLDSVGQASEPRSKLLDEIGDRRAGAALVALLRNERDETLRASAAGALGSIGARAAIPESWPLSHLKDVIHELAAADQLLLAFQFNRAPAPPQ